MPMPKYWQCQRAGTSDFGWHDLADAADASLARRPSHLSHISHIMSLGQKNECRRSCFPAIQIGTDHRIGILWMCT